MNSKGIAVFGRNAPELIKVFFKILIIIIIINVNIPV